MALDVLRATKTSANNWSGVAYSPDVTFEEDGSSAHKHYACQITSIKQTGGGKPKENIVVFGNKRITLEKPQEDFEVEVEVVPTDTTWDQMLFGGTLTSGAIVSGTEYKTTGTQKRWRVIITWQDDTATEKLRWAYKDCFAVSWEPQHDGEDIVKGTIRFKLPSTDRAGVSNIIKEWRSSGSLTTLAAAHGGAEDVYVYNP